MHTPRTNLRSLRPFVWHATKLVPVCASLRPISSVSLFLSDLHLTGEPRPIAGLHFPIIIGGKVSLAVKIFTTPSRANKFLEPFLGWRIRDLLFKGLKLKELRLQYFIPLWAVESFNFSSSEAKRSVECSSLWKNVPTWHKTCRIYRTRTCEVQWTFCLMSTIVDRRIKFIFFGWTFWFIFVSAVIN